MSAVRLSGAREQALSKALGTALDELKVFIQPPIQKIVVRLTVGARGMFSVTANARQLESLTCTGIPRSRGFGASSPDRGRVL
jgi:hypothetical protein